MVILKYVIFIFFYVFASSDAKKKYIAPESSPVRGTVTVHLPDDVPKPDALHIQLKLSGMDIERGGFSKFIDWSTCDENVCPYEFRSLHSTEGQKYAIGVRLHYDLKTEHGTYRIPYGEKAEDRGTPNKLAWSKDIGVLKKGVNKQDIKYDAAIPTITLLN
ncbi:hypothetical protein DdX_13526 [Ditylenchus destructor]|uniref:MD-2-related lipid-recognition domain-containing protein n=1 Tax=Ditylenchus destructor TaxID=166010 RepID=A0AAD4MYI0_9BILA|nr:hypothetical protein DdX_13526 [Ditylenchus destructor]